jgi:F0F1-type ATP synthase membrane subunit b/b'
MDATLLALGGILLKALPTFILVLLLNFYLKAMFFKPLEKVLRERYEATEGARKLAAESIARAAARTAEYEAAIRAARAEVYQAQDQVHTQIEERRAAELADARHRSEAAVRQAKAQLAADVEDAKRSLALDAESLSSQIADAILARRAA